jgi:hypothetical protein
MSRGRIHLARYDAEDAGSAASEELFVKANIASGAAEIVYVDRDENFDIEYEMHVFAFNFQSGDFGLTTGTELNQPTSTRTGVISFLSTHPAFEGGGLAKKRSRI